MYKNKRISKTHFIKTLQNKEISLFNIVEIKKLFNLNKDNTLRHLLMRLKKEGIISSLAKGKYLFDFSKKTPSEYKIANFLVSPSYISLETALSFYHIITQFPYKITSITVKKTKQIKIKQRIYSFSKIKKNHFEDFIKMDDFLIASLPKVFFDYYYFVYNGLRSLELLDETDKKFLTNKQIKNYLKNKAKGKFKKFLENRKLI